MRLLLMGFGLLSIGSLVSAAYSSKSVENYTSYAHQVSHAFALGENNDASGWRECLQMENDGNHIGLACDGVRTIEVHGRRDVNYYCEFRFKKVDPLKYIVQSESCQ